MLRELSATSLSEVLPLISNSLQSEVIENISSAGLSPIRCCFANHNNNVDQYLWLTKGSQLDIISVDPKNVSNQRLLGSIDFRQVLNDNIKILDVLQLTDSTSVNSKYIYTLVVTLRRSSGTCLICLIDVRLSLILKTIETPFKITSLEVISTEKPLVTENWPLIDEMLQMNGILAIGTEGGLVFIVDLFLDNETPLHEALVPKKLSFIVCNSSHINLKAKRKTALLHDQLICLPINSDSHHKNRFVYKADDGAVLSAFPKAQVSVSAIQYIPQIAMLCIGFNFGGFQFYNMKTFRLECSCGLEYGLPPVLRFVFQDPENDPKNHSYVWVIRGQEIEDNSESESSQQYFNSISNAIMYSISFETKEWIPEYGILYSGFQGCSCRFEYILGPNPHFPETNLSCSSRLIDCYTIPLGNYSSHKTSDDESVNLDLSLLLIAWEALSDASEGNSLTYFAIFDLNQWYRTQMPTDFKTSDEKTFSPYLGVFSLVDIANKLSPDAILSVRINKDSITKFRSQAFQDDIHYFPSSLSFDVTILTESQICNASYLGLPKRCLSQMNSPNLLIDPKEFINVCVNSGLLPYDLHQNTLSSQLLREIVLTVALENDCLPFIIEVIKEWSSGELTHCGCDSKFILDWIWKRVSAIKNEIDLITYPLFNFSGQLLDNFNLSQLYAYESDLKSLGVLLIQLQTSGAPTTQQGMQELALRQEVTQMISKYLRTLLWIYYCNLLPEHSEEDVYGEREVAYPSSQFKDYYSKRRTELQQINPSVIRPTDLLLIDGMVDAMNPGLSAVWINGGGDGLYPPPNLHSLVGIYLLESVSTVQKQALMLYSLLDLSEFLSDRQSDIVEKFRHFPSVFGLKPGLTKMIQGFWGLDHKLFDFALRYLLDPVVKPLLLGTKDNEMFVFNDLQQRIVTSLLYQEEVRSALIYSQNCSQFSLDNPLREKLHLNMLLINEQISRAFHYQKLCRNESNAIDLLTHLFQCCEKMGAFDKIFDLNLDEFEEEVLTNYLLSSDSPNSKQMLVLYLVINNKIIDASNVLKQFKEEFTNISDKHLAEKTNQLINLVDAYMSALPQSLTRLATEIATFEQKKLKENPKITVSDVVPIKVKPKPLTFDWVAPSKAIENIMEQIADIWSKEGIQSSNVSTPILDSKKSASKLLFCQNSPFLRTPTADPRSAKKLFSTKTVYPTPKLENGSALKAKGRTIAEGSSRTRGNGKGIKQINKRLDSSQNELLSILDTPSIKRKSSVSKSKTNYEISVQNCFTPTSILKVKQMMKRSTSPSSLLSSPISSKATNKPLESTPLQHKLRFSVPGRENTYTIPEEDSVENPRLALTKDTLLLKSLRSTSVDTDDKESNPIQESVSTNLLDLENTDIDEQTFVGKTIQTIDIEYKKEVLLKPNFVFSPPQTRMSAKKSQQKQKTNKIKLNFSDNTEDKPSYQFSQLEEQKSVQKPKKTKEKPKKEKKQLSKSAETSKDSKPEEPMNLDLSSNVSKTTIEPIVEETPSRASTPASNVDDSDNKSDVSHVSSSKASTRSSRSKTPTKKNPKKVIETPTHSMKLRASTTKTKKEK